MDRRNSSAGSAKWLRNIIILLEVLWVMVSSAIDDGVAWSSQAGSGPSGPRKNSWNEISDFCIRLAPVMPSKK